MAGLAAAQKPKSNKERDAVIAVQNATTADARITAVDNLITNFADTEFKAWALSLAAQAESMKGDSAKAIIYANRALDADPKSYQAMLLVAGELAAHTREFDLDKDDKLARAEKLANDAMAAIDKAVKPGPQVTDAQWANVKKDSAADAHKDLGLIAVARKKYDVAITEYRMAIDGAATPDPADRVRLASVYIEVGKADEALAEIGKTMADPNANPAVKKFAQTEQAQAEKLKAGQK